MSTTRTQKKTFPDRTSKKSLPVGTDHQTSANSSGVAEPDGPKPSETNNLSPKQATETAGHLEAAETTKPVDLLRDNLNESHRDALLRLVIQGVVAMDHLRLRRVAQCLDIVKSFCGCDSPFETLLYDLVGEHYEWGGITPDKLAAQLDPTNTDSFRVNFDDAMRIARNTHKIYGDLVVGGAK